MTKKDITKEKLTALNLEVYRLFVNNIFNLISLSRVRLDEDKGFRMFMKLTDKDGIKHSFMYSKDLRSIVYRNLAGTTVFNPEVKTGIINFLTSNFDSSKIKTELQEFEVKLNHEINKK